MGLLTREEILAAKDARTQVVPVPEWGGDVQVKLLSGTERDAFEAAQNQLGDDGRLLDFRARFCAATLCGEDGEPLFAAADVAALGKKSSVALGRVFEAAWSLNKMGKADVEAAEKNSGTGPSAGSTSA